MQNVNGTSYHLSTPAAVISILENSRQTGKRLRLHFGDVETGRDWLEEHDVTGRVGRSTGTVKIPLLIANARSHGGGGILDHCIVKIRAAAGGAVLYQHPKYHLPRIQLRDEGIGRGRTPWLVLVDGAEHARFETDGKRERWLARMGIYLPAPHTENPESSGRWECPFCGELDSFVGHDDEGKPGNDADDHDESCGAYDEDGDWTGEECTCESVTFSQPVRVIRDETGAAVDFDYGLFLPALYEAEIGSYTRIDCGTCEREIWNDDRQDGAA